MQKRHQNYALVAIIITLMCGVFGTAPRASAQTPGWSGLQKMTDEEIEYYPDVAYDSAGDSHVIYTRTPDLNTASVINYRSFRNGALSGPVQLSSPGLLANRGRIASVTVNGQLIVGVAYKGRTGDNGTSRIYYRQSNDGGRTWSPQEQVTGTTSYEPSLAFDAAGKPHIIASQQFGEDLNIIYTNKVGAGWANQEIINPGSTTFNRDGSLIVTGPAGNQTIHAIFGGRAGGLSRDIRVYYTRKQPGQNWTTPRLMQNMDFASYPDITSDGNNTLNAVWMASPGDQDFEIYTARSTDNGATWSAVQGIGIGGEGIGQTPSVTQSTGGTVIAAWEDSDNTADGKRDIFSRFSTNGGTNWGGLVRVNDTPGLSRDVEVAAGPTNARAVWHDAADGTYHIYTSTTPVSGSVVVNADPVVENDTPFTSKPTVTVTFKDVRGTPRDIRWRWNKAPTDADADSSPNAQGWVGYAATMQIAIPESLRTGACGQVTLFVQTRDANGAVDATVENDAITFDGVVQANVSITNPNKKFGLSTWQQGANGGLDSHTRTRSYNILFANTGECVGLKEFAIEKNGVEAKRVVIPDNTSVYNFPATIPDDTPGIAPAPGKRPDFSVNVYDKLDNKLSLAQQIWYDPRNVNDVANAGAPVLTQGGTLAVNGANTLLRTLTISATASDEIYNRATGKPYWGVWVAATKGNAPLTEAELISDTSTLQWASIWVPNAGAPSVNVKYALNTNLGTPALTGAEGTYYVYVKFLDGAGNPSTGTLISGPVTLAAGYKAIDMYLPSVRK